jgi:hypothetical protein
VVEVNQLLFAVKMVDAIVKVVSACLLYRNSLRIKLLRPFRASEDFSFLFSPET